MASSVCHSVEAISRSLFYLASGKMPLLHSGDSVASAKQEHANPMELTAQGKTGRNIRNQKERPKINKIRIKSDKIRLKIRKDHFWNLGVTSFNSVNQVVIKR
jgi:hypothetical protein